MRIYLVAFFTFLVFLGTAQESQEGYIINQKNDTIRGRIVQLSKGEWFRKCFFTDQNGNETKYFAKDKTISGFGFDRMHFLLNQKAELFMQLLIKGEVSLYYDGDAYYIDQDNQLYEVKPDKEDVYVNGARYENDEKRWKGMLTQLASTCEQAKTTASRRVSCRKRVLPIM